MRPRNLGILAEIMLLEQRSASFSLKGQRVNIVLASHKISVTDTQLCCTVQKHIETIFQGVTMAMLQKWVVGPLAVVYL